MTPSSREWLLPGGGALRAGTRGAPQMQMPRIGGDQMRNGDGRAGDPLAIEENRDGDERVIALSGELDLSNADRLRDRLESARADAERVIVDLSRLAFIDSTGLRVLLRAEQASRTDGGKLSFVRARGQVERVMKVAGIDAELSFVD